MPRFTFPFVLFFLLLWAGNVSAQKGKRDTVVIKTSAHCEFCEKDILKQLKSMKGVKEVSMEKGSGMVRVVYNSQRISADSLRGTLNVMGYDADEKPAKNRLLKFKQQQCTEK